MQPESSLKPSNRISTKVPVLPLSSTESTTDNDISFDLPPEQILLEWLCTEIARDGGATLVTSLKDHYWQHSPKRLNALLVQSPIGKPRLLKFLEYYTPSIFQVDRNSTPHWVILVDRTSTNPYIRSYSHSTPINGNHPNDNPSITLRHKVVYILRRRQSRLYRRAQHDLHNHPNSDKVNVHWLIRQCPWEIHFYLRDQDYYRQHAYKQSSDTVHAVMSAQWQELVQLPFLEFLFDTCKHDLEVDRIQRRISLKEESCTTILTDSFKGESSNQSSSFSPHSQQQDEWLHAVIEKLIYLVQQDGATQVSLGLLLHRHSSLKQLLGGRDLWLLFQQHSERFTTLDGALQVFPRNSNRDIHLQWKPNSSSDINRILESTKKSKKPRMKVDTVGLFSVTNSRWASAIANIIVQCCQQIQWNVPELTAIDMTASVGGMTLGLAKAKITFHKILAMEIDATRAKLCQENMRDHGISEEQVQVIHTDSVEAIPTFPSKCCIVIDPPWGGEHYKEYKDQPPLQLGPWTMEDVLCKISRSVPLCVVAMRLPVTLKVEPFLDQLFQKGRLQFERLSIRKLSVQVLVVLKLIGNTNESQL